MLLARDFSFIYNSRLFLSLHQTSADGNITTSSLTFTPQPEDDGGVLRCLAETHADLSTLEDTLNLTVYCEYK